MFANGIVVKWSGSREYISVDLSTISVKTQVPTTLEVWTSEHEIVRYNTSSTISKKSNDTFELQLVYKNERNQHIPVEDACWGTSTIVLRKDSEVGTATWKGFEASSQDGTVGWKRISSGLFKEAKRRTSSRLEREQDEFRAALLCVESSCVITGEKTKEALEAAHVIPSKNSGAEVVENGILLRADLHRLYDREKFWINPSGRIVEINGVSEEYKRILRGSKLPAETLKRVSDAILHQWLNRKT